MLLTTTCNLDVRVPRAQKKHNKQEDVLRIKGPVSGSLFGSEPRTSGV